MPIYKKVNTDFFKTWSPMMAYVLGFFAADGWITCNKRGCHFFCIQITDGKLLEKMQKVLGSNHKIGLRKKGNHKQLYRLQIGSKKLCADLYNLGFRSKKTHSMVIPSIPREFLCHFVRGYFDGDGHVWVGSIHKEREVPIKAIQVGFTSCSGEFLAGIKRCLEDFEITGSLQVSCKKTYCRLYYSIQSSLKLYDFMYNSEDSGGLFLPRKKIVFEEYIRYRKESRLVEKYAPVV